jgi:succinate-semialdehyde dehydrogenase/glutarate-semialdehyde dehydrogenase
MGGVGDSGIGRRHGPEGIRRFLEPRTVSVSRVGPFVFPDRVPTGWIVSGSLAAASAVRYVSRTARTVKRAVAGRRRPRE